ncbi:MAG: YebC/PmpR family DNA-binding transcriptional regulator [Deltaproteobacteria bacterium]|nr:YebC/PmpR family DNA-binding transcriptional regulator [Deltaproteobacteria bacterium]
MSGHSKWSTIKRKKGVADARRGKIFTKLIKEIIVAARMGGGDPEHNPRLRQAIAAAKSENMPKDNIERAIKKGTGELAGETLEEFTYEGYGPGGVALLIDLVTDNKKRTAAEIRHILSKHNGNLGESGCVSWMFEKKGYLLFSKDEVEEDKLIEIALENGADDVKETDKEYEVITSPQEFENVKKAIEEAGINYQLAEITMIPQSTVKLTGKDAEQMLKLMDALEESDDVQKVYANFDIPDAELEALNK